METIARQIKIIRHKLKYKIRKQGDRWNVFFYGGPLERGGFPTRRAARRRLREYFRRVNWNDL